MHILIIKTSSLGDIIHMLPAITDAARAIPALRIDWLVEESFAAIPAWHPAVGRIVPIAMRRWKKQPLSSQTWKEIANARQALRTQRYDLILDSQGLLKSALWCKMGLGPSAGYDHHSAREPLAARFYDRPLPVARQQHAIARNRQLLAAALGYSLDQPEPDYGLQNLAKRLPVLDLQLPPGSVVGLHGTSRADKLWPVEHWKALALHLQQQGTHLVLPWGNAPEQARAQALAQNMSHVIVLPKLGLDALASLIAQAAVVVGVDTGLLHLAAGLGKPGVALYTATPPALTGAVSDRSAPTTLRNLCTTQELQASTVISAVDALLRNQRRADADKRQSSAPAHSH